MFVPSGTMGNLVALMAHTGRGGEVLLEESSHILKSEMGAIAQVAGLFHRTIRGERGAMDLGILAETISAQMKPNKLATALIEMETTHNGAGGTVLPLDHMAEVHALGQQHGIPVHTDGARLFNAAVALGVPAERDRAPHRQRDVLRLEGLERADRLAALRHEGLHHPRARLPPHARRQSAPGRHARRRRHRRAGQHGRASGRRSSHARSNSPTACIASPRASSIRNPSRPTSCASIRPSAAGRPRHGRPRCSACDVRVSPGGPMQLRFVTHRHISPADIETTLQAFRDAVARGTRPADGARGLVFPFFLS